MTSPEYQKLLEKEKRRNERNKIANGPINFITYGFAVVFLVLVGYIIYFMAVDSTTIIANSANKRQDYFADKVVRGDIITSDGKVVATNQYNADGTYERYYPYGDLFCHVAGFVDYGRSGLELEANYYLLTSSANIFERVYNTLQEEKNIGDNVITTLDYDLQKVAYDSLGSANGAVIVMEPDTGKILAMVSKPTFNPNDIDTVWAYATSEEGSGESMLLNRATQGLYAPGSTFKTLTALEYIREHGNYESYTYNCESEGIFNSVTIHCAGGKVHGTVNVADSLAYSCNTSFANMGTDISMTKLKELCEDFLYNSELPYNGVYSKSRFYANGSMDESQIPQTVIGQGDTQITPLHNAMIMSTIANGGIMMKPYLMDSIENYEGVRVKKFTSNSYKRIISTEEAELLTELLTGVVEYGTASSTLLNNQYTVAGKTGTAEYGNDGKVNSWFVGFSNVENPDIVVSIVIEDADTQGVKATAVAKKIFDAYYEQ